MGFRGLLVFCRVIYLKMKHSCFVFIGFSHEAGGTLSQESEAFLTFQ
jgi:hypothetical protein